MVFKPEKGATRLGRAEPWAAREEEVRPDLDLVILFRERSFHYPLGAFRLPFCFLAVLCFHSYFHIRFEWCDRAMEGRVRPPGSCGGCFLCAVYTAWTWKIREGSLSRDKFLF